MELSGKFITLDEAAKRMSKWNPLITMSKLKKYAEPNAKGDRLLPFIKCEMTGRLVIDEAFLSFILRWYQSKQLEALRKSTLYGLYCEETKQKRSSV